MALGFLAIFLAAFIAGGLWLIDRRAEQRLVAFLPVVAKASKDGANATAAEIDMRLGGIVAAQKEIRSLLRDADGHLATTAGSITLMPVAIESLRKLLNSKFEEWEERQVPPEGAEIAATAMSKIRSAREQIVRLEEESLKTFLESADGKAGYAPLIRVRAGD